MAKQKPRVLVVEDDRPIRSSLAVALAGEGYEVEAQADARAIQQVAERFRPDLAILDVRLPDGPDGYAAARLLGSSSDIPILFLTAADGIDDRLAGFEAGGDDYLAKPFSMAELLARTRALLRRAGRLSSAVQQISDLVIDDGARTVVRNGSVLDLTRTEYDLLSALAHHPGQVLSKVQLLTQVWGFEAYDTNLVEVHMSSLRRKLEAQGPRVIQTVRGVGYVVRP
ncbi:MAG: response regulator transcription factor [Actinomycetota bacterium]|nr:response regulator transcription factor [Actinomycetota bacterium]